MGLRRTSYIGCQGSLLISHRPAEAADRAVPGYAYDVRA